MGEFGAIIECRLTEHARWEMERRQISEFDVAQVLAVPQQTSVVRTGRAVYQSQLKWGAPQRAYLLRVFVDLDREPPEVVTVYRTSKIEKYWRAEQ